MKYIRDLREGERVSEIYYVKHKAAAVTKNGKPYENVILQDRTGTIDAKVWEPNSPGIDDFDAKDYVEINGEVSNFMGQLQLSIKRARRVREEDVDVSQYMPMTEKNIDEMYKQLTDLIASIKNDYYRQLLENIFVNDEDFKKRFCKSSAAKSVHHGFIGGLLEHTLSVTQLCDFYAKHYPVLKRDLLLTAAMCHDIAKVREISPFPENDYTDDGNFLGHIVMGANMVGERAAQIPGFPKELLLQLQHCILAHHGKYEYGSPKLPSLIEAVALNYADDTDAKMETFKEILDGNQAGFEWMGYNRLFETNIRATRID